MVDEIKPVTPETVPSIVETPEPKPEPTMAEALYAKTPGEVKPPVVQSPDVVKPDTPETVITDTKPPKEPAKDQAKPAGEATPVEYDLKLPENSPLTTEDLAALSKEAKDKGLTKEQAEARLKTENDVAVRTATRVQQNQEAAVKAEQSKWIDMVKADPEIGGDKFKETAVLASRAYNKLASPAMKEIVNKAGFGNHPEFVRMMAKAGRMMAEDTVIAGRSGGVTAEKSTAAAMYGATTPGADGKIPGA